MARVTQEHLDARRRQILESARRQFGLKGVDPGAATIDDVAADAGLSKGSIYSYFENKESLLAAVRAEAAKEDLSMAREALDESTTGRQALSGLFRRVWDGMVRPENRERNMLSYDYLLHELRNDEISDEFVERPVNGITSLIEAAQREGSIGPDLDARILATTIWNTQQGTRAYYLRTGDRDSSLAVLEMLEQLLDRSANADTGDRGG